MHVVTAVSTARSLAARGMPECLRSRVAPGSRANERGVAMVGNTVVEWVRRRWFLLGIVAAISLAKLYPQLGAKGGPLKPEISVKYVAVSLIFLNSGLSLKTEELTRALAQVRLHVLIQGYTLVFIPIMMTLLVKSLSLTNLIEDVYLSGLHVVGCMPPPVSSAVILTKAVGGNEAAAIFNSAFGSFLGIFVTPMLLLVLVGTSTTVPFASILLHLSFTVLVPLLVGQVLRSFVKGWLEHYQPPFGTLGSCILLLIIYTTFCDTFHSSTVHFSITGIVEVIVIVVLCQCVFLALSYLIATQLKSFTRHDIIAILFCSTHKSLTLGIPILKIIFSHSSNLSALSLPLLVYHPTQILLGSALVPMLQSWVSQPPTTSPTLSRTQSSSSLKEQA